MRVRDLLRVQEGTVSAYRDPVGVPPRATLASDFEDLDDDLELVDDDAEPQAVALEQRDRPGAAQTRGATITEDFQRHRDEAERAWRRLVAHGHRRRRRLIEEGAALESAGSEASEEELSTLLAALARIEGRLGTLVEVSLDEAELPPAEGPVPPVAEATASAAGPDVIAASGERAPKAYSVGELVREVEALESRTNSLRDELIARYGQADEELARLVSRHGSAPSERRELRRGEAGPAVERVTLRLSRLRSPATGKPYLDGPRQRFDAETEGAVRAFQRDHDLVADGVLGPRTSRVLIGAYAEARSQTR